MTGVELLLWANLRGRQLGGHKFRRQVPIGPYVVDFACYQARLVIEIDGPAHAFERYEARRTAHLEGRGFRVIRFSADDVLQDLDSVLETIIRDCSAASRGHS